jgi:hypothetical protein
MADIGHYFSKAIQVAMAQQVGENTITIYGEWSPEYIAPGHFDTDHITRHHRSSTDDWFDECMREQS